MELRNLTTFVAVVETGSMTAASARCNITQAAVSQQIKNLEDEVGMRLLHRGSELKPTEAGRLLYDRARQIVSMTYSVKDELMAMKGEVCGDLHIGAGSFIEPFMCDVIARFVNAYPKVRLHVHFGYAHVLNRMLRDGEIDVAFSMNMAHRGEGIVSRRCFRYKLCAVMGKEHPLASKEKVTADDLSRCRIIMPDTGEREMDTFQRYVGFDIAPIASISIGDSNNANAILTGVINLDAVTFLPIEYVRNRPEFAARPIEGLDGELWSNAHRMEGPMKESARRFVEMAISTTKHIDSDE